MGVCWPEFEPSLPSISLLWYYSSPKLDLVLVDNVRLLTTLATDLLSWGQADFTELTGSWRATVREKEQTGDHLRLLAAQEGASSRLRP